MKKFWLKHETSSAPEAVPEGAAADTPPPTPAPADPKPPRPEPAHEDVRAEAPEPVEEKAAPRLAPVAAVELDEPPAWWDRLLWIIPAVMTVASAVFTLWSVWDLATGSSDDLVVHAAGLAAGVVVEGGWVWMLILTHRQAATGHITAFNTVAGWALAGVTALILAAHGIQADSWGLGLLAGLPLIAKAAWHGLTTARADAARARLAAKAAADKAKEEARKAKEEQERLDAEQAAEAAKADDSSLTVEQRQRIAQLENEALFAEAEAKAKIRRDDAIAKADSDASIAQIKRQAKENMARMDATAELMVHKAQLEERIELSSPPRRQMIALGSGAYAPDDASALDGDGGMGFASAMNRARMDAQVPTVRTGVAEQVPAPAAAPARGGAQVSAEEGARNRALVWDTRDRLLEETGREPSINALAKATGLSRRAVGRHLEMDD